MKIFIHEHAHFLVNFEAYSYGVELAQLGGLAHLGKISPSLRDSYKNVM